ncbi:cytochrome P450 [Mycobacterium vicinigordonae]|uniref:Cytochrome P450 n=1 Tax=Mycobacterium vicinigordonae TaxID=1719132 RepID=A0A7D6E4V8_9MYCO|nr:cytochrome P450 [Mycobacterium vicinigordonae]QLL07402.1 cytochrome P450 [Mycobacterium vicinigordonae]
MKASGLDGDLDQAISAIPDALVRPLDSMLVGDLPELRRPYQLLGALRDEAGAVVAQDPDGTFGGQTIPTSFVQPPGTPLYFVLGWEAANEVLRNPALFANGDGAYGVFTETFSPGAMPNIDGAEHRDHRKLMLQAFGVPAIGRLVADLLNPLATFLVDRVARRLDEGLPVCAARDIGLPMAFRTITELMGLPHNRFAEFMSLACDAFDAPSNLENAMLAHARLNEMWTHELAERRQRPTQDLISWLAAAELTSGRQFTDEEIFNYARVFLPAGVETTARQIPLLLMAVLENPADYAALVADPALIDPAIEEAMRYLPAVLQVPRRATADTTLAGVALPAGASVIVWTGIANRDPAAFERPDRFDLRRPRKQNLTFSAGPHFCLGAPLARTEMRLVLDQLIRKIPNLRLNLPAEEIDVRGLGVRSPQRVPLGCRSNTNPRKECP